MSKLHMLAGAVAADKDAGTEHVCAYVVLADGAKSRVFKLHGEKKAPVLEELPAATTLDLRRFQEEIKRELSGHGPARPADPSWACDFVRVHVRLDLGS